MIAETKKAVRSIYHADLKDSSSSSWKLIFFLAPLILVHQFPNLDLDEVYRRRHLLILLDPLIDSLIFFFEYHNITSCLCMARDIIQHPSLT
jgi:hypothetical protein